MPDISTIPIPYYQPLDPYNHVVDNQPIHALAERTEVLDVAIDINTAALLAAAGNQGTVGNRINQFAEEDGTLKSVAIDNSLHAIEAHLDGGGYVRMLLTEREKLSSIADEATNLRVNVETISGVIPFANSTLDIYQSDTVWFRYENSRIYADAKFPDTIHRYDYGATTTDYQTYQIAVPYKIGKLRVYVNGIRLKQGITTPVPTVTSGVATWTSVKYTEGEPDTDGIVQDGSFSFTTTLNSSMRVFADADMSGGETVDDTTTPVNGSSIVVGILQEDHGFDVGDLIRYDGSEYVKADATTVANSSVIGMVSVVTDADNFTVTFAGKVSGLSGLTPGGVYYLSETAGGYTTTAPEIRKPVLLAVSTTVGYLAGFNLESNLLGVSTDGSYNFIPDTDAVQDLGSPSKTWDTVYTGSVVTDAVTLNTNDLTSTDNILNFDGDAVQVNGFGFSSAKVTQNSHGFVAGDVLRISGALFVKAIASSAAGSNVVGMVAKSIDVNTFLMVSEGHVTGLSGLTSGNVYFLSPSVAGAVTTTEPSTPGQYSKPVLVADGTTSGYFVNWRGTVVAAATTAWLLEGNDGTTAGTNFIGTTDDQDLVIKTGDGALPQERIRVKGNLASGEVLVGVNAAAPTSTIDVDGSVGDGNFAAITGDTTLDETYSTVACDATGGQITVTLPNANTCERRKYVIRKTDTSSNAVVITPSGADQIDSQASISLWSVYQTAEIQSDGDNRHVRNFWHGGQDQFGNVRIGTGTSATVRFHVNATEKMRLTSTGLGLAQTVPTALLELGSDDAKKPGTNSWSVTSSRLTKRAIAPSLKGLKEVEQTNIVNFEHNGQGGTIEGLKGVGVIAEEIIEIFPESVKSYKGIVDGKEMDIPTFNNHELNYAIVNAVKELSQKIKDLKQEIEILKSRCN